MNLKKTVFVLACILTQLTVNAQTIEEVVKNARMKIEKVKNYEAVGKMKTNVVFLKVPVASVKIYFLNPDKFKLTSDKGLSFVPKGSMNLNLNSVFSGNKFTLIDAGNDKIGTTSVRVVKLLPDDENSDMVLTTLYIDPLSFLILKSKTTTRENGTYELNMKYARYAQYGLPDEILFSFNTRDYKLPKGITFDFDDGSSPKPATKSEKSQKGEVLISVSSYTINKGLAEKMFK